MKAVRFHEYGEPGVLQLEDVDLPEPGADQVRIRVAASAFNPADANIRAGYLRDQIPVALPHVPGYDVAGTVDALGHGVDTLTVGDAVVGFLPMTEDGAAAEFVVAPAASLTAAPTTVPLPDAAALPSVALTARQALFDLGGLRAGDRVLVTGAGGAVGDHAVRLATHAGATVFATASARSRDRVADARASTVLAPDADLAAAVGAPLDLVLNLAPVTPEQLTAFLDLVRPGGALVSTTVWMPAPSDEARGVRGLDVFVRSDAGQLAELVAAVDRGELRVDVAERVALADLPALHARAAAGDLPSGKVVVTV